MPYSSVSANRALRANFGDDNIDSVETLYVALMYQATPGDVSTVLGTELSTDGNYARVAVPNTDAEWEISGLSVINVEEIRWPIATDLYSIGTEAANQWAIYDLSTAGDLICWGVLSPTIEVTGAGDQPVIPATDLIITQAL